MTVAELIDRWEARCAELRQLRATVDGPTICEQAIADLRNLSVLEASEVLGLRAAAERSGYSVEHIGRLIRSGKLRNVGRKHAPRVRAQDLPRRVQQVATGQSAVYDSSSDARSLRSRR
jgi:hypothetical protein